MKSLTKKLAFAAVAVASSFGASAATSCVAEIHSVTNTSRGVVVKAYNPTTWRSYDTLTISYQDPNLGSMLDKLTTANNFQLKVRIYILEEFDGDDARSCTDGVADYIGSVHSA
ncbi:hypothetical protein [Pseudoalteromonas luteoviolacea]|uniref:Uncharacterized protein n=1 Tax=Pseudoalteromonas luteoviolacea S4060-1 TaxID=1365257 RepID=A0A162BBX2_9GAMM|nr:hypothetical protein [Pseudoalteromonas luteoviolacea]KZN34327.1 hypothetical protein N480_22245 [Pseudoalteromonas luteoviolacea S2607]KZN69875.1 hypothetical protein N478_10285 [Pseudoalteromonas luteoviolacea S4060-1]